MAVAAEVRVDQAVQEPKQLVDRLLLDEDRYLHSTRAELLHRLGCEAAAVYRRAIAKTCTDSERSQFERRLAMIETMPEA